MRRVRKRMSGDEEVYVVSRDLSDVDAVAKGEGKWRRATVARLAENSCNQSCKTHNLISSHNQEQIETFRSHQKSAIIISICMH
jgi:hypothetical protein